jgi:hypothetical protein
MGIYGNRGSGKTLFMVHKTFECPNIPCKSNFKIESDRVFPLEVFELLDLNPDNKPTIVNIDEAYTWLESRVSTSKLNRYVSYVGFQSRKRNLDILFSAQLSSSIDVRFRDTEDYRVFCKDRPNPRTSVQDFKYAVCKGRRTSFQTMKFKEAKKLFDIYNTDEVIKPPDMEELQAEIEVLDPHKLNIEVDKLVKLIRKKNLIDFSNPKAITHDVLKDVLLRIEKPFSFEPYVYVRLKSGLNDD